MADDEESVAAGPVANDLRGEVDLVLEGQSFVLRPSYTAQREIETLTGKSILALATSVGDGELSLTDAAIIVTAFIKAWGRSVEDRVAQAVSVERIGELIVEYGLMQVQLRLSIVLTWAVTGGCKADGTRKDDDAGETTATEETSAISVAGKPD